MIKQYVKKNGTKAWMFNEYIGTDPTTGKKKIVTKRGFKSEKETQSNIEPHEGGFRTRRAADDEPHQI